MYKTNDESHKLGAIFIKTSCVNQINIKKLDKPKKKYQNQSGIDFLELSLPA